MKIKDRFNEIKGLSTSDLQSQCKDLKEELFNLKFQLSLGQLANTAKIRQVKRDIARINTVLTERELANKEG